METPVERCVRIAGALEDLAGQEAAALAAQDFAAARALQDRAEPLVAFLARHAPAEAGDPALRARLAAVQELRARSSARLAQVIDHARTELEQSRQAQRQIARIAPAYGRGQTTGRAQLSIVG